MIRNLPTVSIIRSTSWNRDFFGHNHEDEDILEMLGRYLLFRIAF